MKRFITGAGLSLITVFLICSFSVSAQQKRIYIAPDDHTDYMWTADEADYRNAFLTMTDYYLDLIDTTAGNAAPFQARWNADGSFWLWTYEKHRTQGEFKRLINRIKDGHFSIPLNALVLTNGGTPAEAVLRGMYYPGLIERRHNLRFPLAVAMENQTLPYGLSSLWAGAGAKYSWKGVCGCATEVDNLDARPREIYYLGGRDGSRVLLKWNSLIGGDNQSIGGYAEARDPAQTVNFVDSNANFRENYPFEVIGIFGQGHDDLQTLSDLFVTTAQNETTPARQVLVSNQIDFFQDFENRHGAQLETHAASYGNEWELYVASLAEVSARIKRATEKLRGAEALAALVSLKDPLFMNGRERERDKAMLNFGLYFEHGWTADGAVSRGERAAWQRRIEGEITSYVESLHTDARNRFGTLIDRSGTNRRFYVFNSLSWTRTDYADFPIGSASPIHVIDVAGGNEVPSQLVSVDGQLRLRILARDIPPVGYKVFEIRDGAGTAFPDAASVAGGVIENAFYRVTVSGTGAITGLIDKSRGNREFVRSIGGRTINDLGGTGGGSLTVENAGPVSVTLKAVSSSPLAHTTRITLIRDTDRIEIRNEITENFGDVRTWGFSFNLDSPDVWHEEVGAVIRAKLLGDGGHYSPQNARYDWLTLNHFADIGDGVRGVTVSNGDAFYMRLGNSTAAALDTATPQFNVLAGGQVDGLNLGIRGQGGDTSFLYRFGLQTRGPFDQTGAMRFALEHQNPFVAGEVTGAAASAAGYPADRFSFLTISNPDVLLWSLKPAEDGIGQGLIARVWNQSDTAEDYTISLASDIISAKRTTHIETDIADALVSGGDLRAALNAQQIQTHRLLTATAAASADISGRILFHGRGPFGKVRVTLIDTVSGLTLRTKTNGNGFFRFPSVPIGNRLVIRAARPGFDFAPAAQSFVHNSARGDLDFTANYRGLQ